ncbi:MAG: Peptidase M10A and M12B matrixin and adamalysin [Parcubacteria group bacterium GW2011_GWB1_57_6]|nr:MAG: Peptidase M10A and M12B matrixin and adamalysin [Parcubacteria group bacterium GW2011_GWA1_56_13]KKW46752.1 MAG: Peptidase M10A and M12B matrixin and adamalysin [Parcubacteria group bacterium GW2011_GWB1_57_6]
MIYLVLLVSVVGGAGYLAYTHQTELRAMTRVFGIVAPCTEPITYSIGSIDRRFGISTSTLVSDLGAAEAVWEKPSNKDLFTYEQQGGDVTIALVYDSRQAATDTLKAAGIQIDKSKASYDALKTRYDELLLQVETEQSRYNDLVAAYTRDEDAYNAEVEKWNRRGGAPAAEYERLQDEKAALSREFAVVKSLESMLNANIDTLNALATTLNQLIVQLNLNVAQYNRTGASAGEFEEGLYRLAKGVQTIDIYEYSNRTQLVRVLAHEMGHALGLEHVADADAIMYKINRIETLKATASDMAELSRVCRK